MKIFSALLLALLLTVAVRTQTNTASCATSGSTANYFLAWAADPASNLGNTAPLVLANPQVAPPTGTTAWPICNHVFSQAGGACCDVEQMKVVYKAQISNVLKGWNGAIGTIVKVKEVLPKIANLLTDTTMVTNLLTLAAAASTTTTTSPTGTQTTTSSTTTSPSGTTTTNTGTTSGTTTTSTGTTSGTTTTSSGTTSTSLPPLVSNGMTPTQIVDLMKKTTSGFTDALTTFKDKAKACFDHTNTLRARVWCHGCSAAGFSKFQAGPLASYASGSCNTLVSKCGHVWAFLNNAQSVLNFGLQIRNIIQKSKDPNAQIIQPQGPPPSFFRGVTQGQLKPAFDACAPVNFAVSGSCTQDYIDNICISHLNFFKAEPAAMAVNTQDATSVGTGRRLQTSTSTNPGGFAQTTTGGQNMEDSNNVGPESPGSIDPTQAGSTTSSNNAMKSLVCFIALIVMTVLSF